MESKGILEEIGPVEAARPAGRKARQAKTKKPVGQSLLRETWHRLRKDKAALLGGAWLIFIILVSLLAPLLAPQDPLATNLRMRLQPLGTPGHILGTDDRRAISPAAWCGEGGLPCWWVFCGALAMIGTLVGLLTGFFGGWTDTGVMRLIDILMAFPAILLAMLSWPFSRSRPGACHDCGRHRGHSLLCRIRLSSVLALREREFILASRALRSTPGASSLPPVPQLCRP
jgi:peptide/nickel transport system permease protein